ncbi:MAG: 6-carboxytetrahydropterin synthase [Firmicutes bacterium]|nr:6-carboxytetrahydropterin synthase [Bacillota bacterium]
MNQINTSSIILGANKDDVLYKMNAELENILAMNENTLNKAKALQEQIAICEARWPHVELAGAEGQKIAAAITAMAAERVGKISQETLRILRPQHEQLAGINQEIAIIANQLARVYSAEEDMPVAEPKAKGSRREYSLREPQETDSPFTPVAVETRLNTLNERNEPIGINTEASSRAGKEAEALAANQPVSTSDHLGEENQSLVKREYSLREPQVESTKELAPATQKTEPPEADRSLQAKREYSLREPQPLQESSETRASVDLWADEPDMSFDIFLDGQHLETIDGLPGHMHKHWWQVKIEVTVPPPNCQAQYSSVLAALTATLMRFDDVLIDEVFPFTLIEPNMENISMYFYNCLEDNLNLMGLILKQITLLEHTYCEKKVSTRNVEFDALLKYGRDDLPKNEEVGMDGPLKRSWEEVLKPPNDFCY